MPDGRVNRAFRPCQGGATGTNQQWIGEPGRVSAMVGPEKIGQALADALSQRHDLKIYPILNIRCGALEHRRRSEHTLRLLSDKEFLGGNRVCAVTHPAPQWELECSQASKLAFRSLDRGFNKFLGNGTPIRKHEATHPCLPSSYPRRQIGQFWNAVGAWMVCGYLFYRASVRAMSRRHQRNSRTSDRRECSVPEI